MSIKLRRFALVVLVMLVSFGSLLWLWPPALQATRSLVGLAQTTDCFPLSATPCLSPSAEGPGPPTEGAEVQSDPPAAEPSQTEADELESRLKQPRPRRDPIDLSRRLKGNSEQPVNRIIVAEPPDYEIGVQQTFWLADHQKRTYYPVSASLRHKTPHAYFYIEDGQEVPLERLEQAGEVFEGRIYPIVRDYFGSEPYPGIDNDPRITILHARIAGAQGYYSSADEYPVSVNPYSNEREMIYINLGGTTIGSDNYYSTLAHEFQHMIHWNWDSGEDTWVNEGLAELAIDVVGLSPIRVDRFISNPSVQLNAWAENSGATIPHYNAAYLFLSYLAERYGGDDGLKDLVSDQGRGIDGINSYLTGKGLALSFDDVFKDWVVANYLDDPSIADGRYGYRKDDVKVKTRPVISLPVRMAAALPQYSAEYLDLGYVNGDVTIVFTGTKTARLVANDPYSGRREWWSNRGDGMNTTLTREFDLTELDKATLAFSAWYDLEKDYDYAYFEVSTNGGATWTTLAGRHTTDSNPNGNNFGVGYTGKSGGTSTPAWIDEYVDLTPYVGKKVLIRFEYITDDAYNGPGFVVDDVSIPELGYSYDAETEADWSADGFLLSANEVPQRYYPLVVKEGSQSEIETIPLNDERQGKITIHGDGSTKVIVVIAAAAPATTELANYEYVIEPSPLKP
ncbi:MAG: immune inhibitor A [Chloroflexi bacterium]|nr:immune inhibitor A [Chloroflexota bacterium]